MQSKQVKNIIRAQVRWVNLTIIFIASFILMGCSDPSHPEAVKILKEIETELKIKGQVNLSDLSEQFDEICSIIQDDSDEGYSIYLMNKTLKEKNIPLPSANKNIPDNPMKIIILIKGNKAFIAYDWKFYLEDFNSPLTFKDYSEKFIKCSQPNQIITVDENRKFIELR